MLASSVLIPLDGTHLSESALLLLPFLKSIGTQRVHLVSVWEEPEEAHGAKEQIGEITERGRTLLDAYLQDKAATLKSFGFDLQVAVRVGKAAEEILEEAEHSGTEMIVIATHGRSGIARWRLGSVADKVIRGASCFTLVVGPNVNLPLASFEPRVLMVPLDGSPVAEQALPVAHEIAETLRGNIDLVRVVNLPATWTADPMLPVSPVEILEELGEGATHYLDELQDPRVTKRTVLKAIVRGVVSEELLRHVREARVQLVVMTSHARHGVARWALGSVAEQMLLGSSPVLIVRPSQPAS